MVNCPICCQSQNNFNLEKPSALTDGSWLSTIFFYRKLLTLDSCGMFYMLSLEMKVEARITEVTKNILEQKNRPLPIARNNEVISRLWTKT